MNKLSIRRMICTMAEVTFKGNPVTVSGKEVKVGDTAPDFTVLNNSLEEVSLSAVEKIDAAVDIADLTVPVRDGYFLYSMLYKRIGEQFAVVYRNDLDLCHEFVKLRAVNAFDKCRFLAER